MTMPIGSDDAYPEQIATEFVRTTRNNEQEWRNRALAAELNLAGEKRDAREVIGQLQNELDAARQSLGEYKDIADRTSDELDTAIHERDAARAQVKMLREVLQSTLATLVLLDDDDPYYGDRRNAPDVIQRARDALRDTEPHGETEPQP